MIYNTYELIWLFLIYSFLGWMLETILAATEQRRFVNRGMDQWTYDRTVLP